MKTNNLEKIANYYQFIFDKNIEVENSYIDEISNLKGIDRIKKIINKEIETKNNNLN